MSSFVFSTPQGRFPVPDGESRIGSDSSCAICVHGEGILPVHAYVKVDADKLLIRPSSEKAAVMLDGAPVAGPQVVAGGQRVVIGPFELRLETQKPRRRFPVRWLLYAGGAVAGAAVVLVLLRYLWFNEAWWKAKVVAAVESALGRENAKVDSVDADLFRGVLTFRNLRVPNQLPFSEDSSLLKVDRVTVQLDPWVWLKSGFTEVRKGQVTLEGPELAIERVASQDGRPVSNVDDLGARLAQSSTSWFHRLTVLEAQVDVLNGRVIVKDAYAGVGESRLEHVRVTLTQPGFGEPLAIRLDATPSVPEQPAAGRASPGIAVDGQWRVFDAAGRIEGDEKGGGELTVNLKDFDLARLCRHFQWEWRRRGGAQRIVPGKPITGEFRIAFPNLKAWELRGTAASESLVSLYESDGQPPIGNIPTVLRLTSLTYDAEKGRPTSLEMDLRGYRPVAGAGPQSLDDPKNRKDEVLFLHTEGKRLPSGDEDKFVVNLLFPRLQDLCATDVGERLKLKGRLQGSLILNAQLVHDRRKGETRIEGDANLSEDAKVLVPGTEEPQAGRWQPIKLAASFNATASPNAKGEVAKVEARFKARSDSFEAESMVPAVVSSLDAWDRLSIFTKFRMRLMGREFWTEFGPVLGLFGFDRPIEEVLALEVKVASYTVKTETLEDTRRISLSFEGKAARQWKEPGAPVDVLAVLDYYPEFFRRGAARPAGAGAPPPPPYLRLLTLQTGSAQQWPYVEVRDAEWVRQGDLETVRAPNVLVRSDSAALQERFGPYLDRLYGFLGADFLRDYSLGGSLELGGNLSVTRRVGPLTGAPPLDTEFRFTIAGENMQLSGPVLGAAPGPDGVLKRWSWAEEKPQLILDGRYRYEPAGNPEEPDVRRVDRLRLAMQGQLGAFVLAASDLDLFLLGKLAARARTPGKSWPDATGSVQISGTFEPAGFDFLRRLELPGLKPWLHDPLVSGRLELNLDYDRQQDRAKLKKLIFKQAEAPNAFWLKDLNLVAELRAVRALSRELFGRPAGEPLDLTRLLDGLSGAGAAKEHDVALRIHTLAFDAPGFAQWLARHPPPPPDAPREASFADFVPAWLTELLRAKRLDPHGSWSMKDVTIWALEKPERSWGLSGDFQNDLYLTLPPEAALPPGRVAPAPTLAFQGPWRLPERQASLTLSQEGDIYAILRAELDGADITLRGVLPEYVYRKPGKEPLRLELDGLLPLGDRCAFSQLSLIGGPLEMMLTDLQARTRRAPGKAAELDSFTLAGGTVRGGPLFQTCGFENLLYERETGKAGGQVRAVQLDLPALAKLLPVVPGLVCEGRLPEARLDVRGDLAALLALDPDPKRDRLQFSARMDKVLVKIEMAPDDWLGAEISGSLSAGLTRLDAQNLDVSLAQAVPGRKPAPPASHQILLAKGSLATLDPEQSLRQALRKEPFALQLELPAVFKTALDLDALDAALATLGRFWRKTQGLAKRPEGANRFEWLSKLRVDGSLSVPAARSGAWTLERLEVPKYSVREMKVTVPAYGLRRAGGELIFTNAQYDLSHPEVSHTQKFQWNQADARELLGLGAADFALACLMTLEGEISGLGIAPNRSWNGGVDFHLRESRCGAPKGYGASGPQGPDAGFLERLPPLVRKGLANLGGRPTANLNELLRDCPSLSGPAKEHNGLLLALQVLLSAYGVEAGPLEFEPCQVQVTVQNGVASLSRCRLVGRGPVLGLELHGQGKLRLWDGAYDDRWEFWPLQLPASARKVLHLDEWPKPARETFEDEMKSGKLALRITGQRDKPSYEFPFAPIAEQLERALPPPLPPPGKEPPKTPHKPPPKRDLPPVDALLSTFERLRRQSQGIQP
jgi:hypothetical protein